MSFIAKVAISKCVEGWLHYGNLARTLFKHTLVLITYYRTYIIYLLHIYKWGRCYKTLLIVIQAVELFQLFSKAVFSCRTQGHAGLTSKCTTSFQRRESVTSSTGVDVKGMGIGLTLRQSARKFVWANLMRNVSRLTATIRTPYVRVILGMCYHHYGGTTSKLNLRKFFSENLHQSLPKLYETLQVFFQISIHWIQWF